MLTNAHRANAIAGAVLLSALAVFSFGTPASAYDNVQVTNTTRYAAHVQVTYAACRVEHLTVPPVANVKSQLRRGGCLITRITATLTGGPAVRAFQSSGTTFAKFSIVFAGGGAAVEQK